MNRTLLLLSSLTAASCLPCQEVGLELRSSTGPFAATAGSVCVPVNCAPGPQETLTVAAGSVVSAHVFGVPQTPYLLGLSGTLQCQTLPGFGNQLGLGGAPVLLGGVLPAGGFLCGGAVSSAAIFGIAVPASLPPGSQFVFQGLAVSPQSQQFTFTTPVLLVTS
ncbi:MAG: hypothetical protein ACE37K_14860 [Planctomycetota bacterium]|jgi:hypothetical protein